jgi:hypothetical protein
VSSIMAALVGEWKRSRCLGPTGKKHRDTSLQHLLDQPKEVEAEEIQWEM